MPCTNTKCHVLYCTVVTVALDPLIVIVHVLLAPPFPVGTESIRHPQIRRPRQGVRVRARGSVNWEMPRGEKLYGLPY